jgi:prepilin-type N-terminal cleavage/methylation domain-containing protein
MRVATNHEKGFTLIEVIVTLVLMGIMASLAGMWIVSVANGYVFAKMNASTAQKAQLALTRLTIEFQAIQSVDTGNTNGTQIKYSRPSAASSAVLVTVKRSVSGTELLLNDTPLIDGVSAFTLNYCNDDLTTCSASSWSSSSRIIEITLTLKGADDIQSTFTRRIAPRNL